MSGPRSIVIVGNGLGAALAAAMLALRTKDSARIMVLPGGDDAHGLGPVGATIATRPAFRAVLAELGLAEDAVLAATGGAFSLGQAFSGWRGAAHGWMLPHGDIGAPIGSVAFHHLLHRWRSEGHRATPADFAIAAVAAQSDRFARPGDDPASPLSALDHGLTFDSDRLATLFRRQAMALGVRFDTVPVAQVERQERTRLRLNDGRIVTGDLFVDLTGAQALLAAGHGWHDWRRWFPCDRALVGVARDPQPPMPFTHGGATATGWRSSVAIDGARGDVLFVASGFGPRDAAARDLALPVLDEMPVRAGRCERFWDGNVVAMGAAAAGIDPLHPVALDLLAAGVERLLALFPERAHEPLLAAEYDRRMGAMVERTRDFALLHYALADRPEPMWRAVADAPLPDGAAWKLDQYRSRGRISRLDDEMFADGEWAMLFDANGVVAERRDALTDHLPPERLERHFARLREAIVHSVRAMPTHGTALRAIHDRRQAS
ncbi:tryptophan 7-halogenase [Sphingomonas sp. Leaf4]|uniref:tryptophan 7-halogenase n=1 Tax=Sphingomonas sp. Leaf4 TaxID=2876553 RepID=UPI001E28AF1D|nr:tryptophan 7-halogenase [Sphingomonas sp. Leaf4]